MKHEDIATLVCIIMLEILYTVHVCVSQNLSGLTGEVKLHGHKHRASVLFT